MLLTTSMIGLCWLLGISVLEKVTRNVKSDLKLLKRRCVYERIFQVASTPHGARAETLLGENASISAFGTMG